MPGTRFGLVSVFCILLLICFGPKGALADEAHCCMPVAFIATITEVSTWTYNCCCPERECEEREGRTTHRYSGYTYFYECGLDAESCAENPDAIPCNEMAPMTDLEWDSTTAIDEVVCECYQEDGCYAAPPDCLDPNIWFVCYCENPEAGCLIYSLSPGCEGFDPGGD